MSVRIDIVGRNLLFPTSVIGIPRLVLLLVLLLPRVAFADTPEQELAGAQQSVQRALVAAQAGDLTRAAAEYRAYDNTWHDIEDPIRDKSRAAYREIEARMADVEDALAAKPVDHARLVAALAALDREQQLFVDGKPPTAGAAAAAAA